MMFMYYNVNSPSYWHVRATPKLPTHIIKRKKKKYKKEFIFYDLLDFSLEKEFPPQFQLFQHLQF